MPCCGVTRKRASTTGSRTPAGSRRAAASRPQPGGRRRKKGYSRTSTALVGRIGNPSYPECKRGETGRSGTAGRRRVEERVPGRLETCHGQSTEARGRAKQIRNPKSERRQTGLVSDFGFRI